MPASTSPTASPSRWRRGRPAGTPSRRIGDTVKAETLAVSLGFADAPAGTVSDAKLGDEAIRIGVMVA